MTPSYAVKKATRYHYYVSRPLIPKHHTTRSTGLRIPAAEVEQLVTRRVRQWLLDPGKIYQATQLADLSAQPSRQVHLGDDLVRPAAAR